MNKPDLLAAYWTLAGNVYPGAPTEISPFTLKQRVEAASKAGWKGIGLVLSDLQATLAQNSLATIRQLFKDNDIKYFELEILLDWYLTGDARKMSDDERSKMIELGAELGMCNLKVGARPFENSHNSLENMADEFSKLCKEVAQVNANVALEIMPFSRLATLEDGLKVVDTGDVNGGLCLDIWHLARGNIDFEKVSMVPAHLLKSVELNDASEVIQGDLFNDSTHHRKLCGQGSFDIQTFLNEIKKAGFNQPYYGVELISQDHRILTLDEMAKNAYETTMSVFSPELV
ncbi:sugar phosphate isomerase/epimerase [Acinetobacter sp.]|jgi:sugar phosphate isomerase/epimerase|uniref:sugar phosphate isomerase/epimerase family protein n=1 Tax=Acinetobacter sp. TaxID=472 RepID=UPI00282FDC6E|nr:sugar phosphate isomerase/epimerase [Acinetobacter sp.]MDR0237993.1 sugar phosphate isomerase/epimerase [Acinetobacter sp.]